jgi:hypothetical protein
MPLDPMRSDSLAAAVFALAALLLAGCLQREAAAPVRVEIAHDLGARPLQLGAAGSDLSVSRLSYYLGEFRLRSADGRWIDAAPDRSTQGYVLVDVRDPASTRFDLPRVPPGAYTALQFRLGVDAAQLRAGAQTGALDPAAGMFWTWNTGYIFLALEAHSPRSGAADRSLTYHVGGSEALSRQVRLPLDHAPLSVARDASAARIHLRVDLDDFFRGLPLEHQHTVMGSQHAADIADRYAGAFGVAAPSPVVAAAR